ncbi:hypothetical protein [Allomuricauda sp. NBRC 101325]|uniref:hypothetical protein n=1 Tax=Allomuricauda sp. NBRC 101325 TaxID=1113758 RepID=UPI0024A3AE84|nr:hypothetical protein [Muricauda sp. NBRC 101325]GLU44589.1 hypothetical protein Musp01_22130 [Muricauda sp. NBRC 101325]
MNLVAKGVYIVLIGLTFMQAGASLFAIMVNISSLIDAPPASLITVQGPYAFNPDVFWDIFPTLVLIALLLAIFLNWKNALRKWVLMGGFVWMISGIVVFTLLSPVQTEFLSAEFSNTFSQSLKIIGEKWRDYSVLFMILSALSGFIYLVGLIKKPEKTEYRVDQMDD